MVLTLANGCRRCYIRFIRKVNEQRGVEGRDETKKAFDFMLGHIGEFIKSFAASISIIWVICLLSFETNFDHHFINTEPCSKLNLAHVD